MRFDGVELCGVVIDSKTNKIWSADKIVHEIFQKNTEAFKFIPVRVKLDNPNILEFGYIRLINDRKDIYPYYITNWSSEELKTAKDIARKQVAYDNKEQGKALVAQKLGLSVPQETAIKQDFLSALEQSNGDLTTIRRALKIPIKQYKQWMLTDSNFREEVQEIKELLTDRVQSAMFEAIEDERNPTLIKYYLDHQAKDRGFGDSEAVKEDNKTQSIDLDKLTLDEKREFERLLIKMQPES